MNTVLATFLIISYLHLSPSHHRCPNGAEWSTNTRSTIFFLHSSLVCVCHLKVYTRCIFLKPLQTANKNDKRNYSPSMDSDSREQSWTILATVSILALLACDDLAPHLWIPAVASVEMNINNDKWAPPFTAFIHTNCHIRFIHKPGWYKRLCKFNYIFSFSAYSHRCERQSTMALSPPPPRCFLGRTDGQIARI